MEVLSHFQESKWNQHSKLFGHSADILHNGTISEKKINLPTKYWASDSRTFVSGLQSRKLKHRFNRHSLLHSTPTNDLASFKSIPETIQDHGFWRPYMGRCCSRCMPVSRMDGQFEESKLIDAASSFGLTNILKTRTENKDNNILTRLFAHTVFVNSKSRGITYLDLSGKVLQSMRVNEAIKKCSENDLEEYNQQLQYNYLMKEHTKRAIAAINRMKANFSTLLLRISGWFMLKILGRLLRSVQVHQGQITAIKNVVAKKKIPLAFLPIHRSHLDYILVTFILYFNDIRVPYVAAGDNLNIPVFGWLLKCLGGFFIKRKLDPEMGKKDYVYRAILQTYMQEILRNGQNIEFFIEGGRSRTGKSCFPKGGLLSVLVDSCLDDDIEDISIIPVSISYEKIMDGNFNKEHMGLIKTKETFWIAICNIWRVFSSNYGSVRVDFGQPFSLREIIQSTQSNNHSPRSPVSNSQLRSIDSCTSLYGTDIVIDNRTLVKSLANHIVYDSSQMIAVMSTNLLAFLFLNKFRKGASLEFVVSSFEELKQEIAIRDRDVGFSGETVAIIKHAHHLLGNHLIVKEWTKTDASMQEEKNNNVEAFFLKPTIDLPYVFELQYYSNVVVSVFLLESVLANSIYALVGNHLRGKQIINDDLHISKNNLISKAEELCNILQYEFIFAPPCLSIESVLDEAVNRFLSKEILLIYKGNNNSNCHGEIGWANRLADSLSFDPDFNNELTSSADQFYWVNTNSESIEKLQFFQQILSPFIEGYWLSAYHLTKLLQNNMEELAFLRLVHHSAEERLAKGLLTYAESSSNEILQNSLKLFENWKVIESCRHEKLRLIKLHNHYCTKDRLHSILMQMDEFKS